MIRNTSALYLVQIANYVLPLILLPFLTRVLKSGGYGEFATFQAIIAYGLVVTDYGFQLSATRKVAGFIEKNKNTKSLYVNVTIARVILGLAALAIMCVLALLLPNILLSLPIFVAFVVIIMSNAFTPIWLFQGFQRMVTVSILILFSRIGSIIFTFLLVQSSQDVDKALWAQALGFALPVCFALWQAQKLVQGAEKPTWVGVKREFTDGWPIFQTSLFGILLTNSGVLILSAVAGSQVAGGYAAIERVAKGVATMLSPVTQSIYPRISAAFARSHEEGVDIIIRFGRPLLVASLLLAVFLITISVFGGVGWLFGQEYQRYAGVLFVLSPWMILGVVNNILGIQYLINTGQQTWYATAFTASSIFGLVLFLTLSRIWSYWGIAWGLVLGEFMLSIALIWRIYSIKKVKIFKKM
ncbi:oligosaccharide flippase family protein [Deinococcus sp. SM5_A1]|uniref:oligosaccharide flippase family protein n=1 Tax=Deinococcus sp. SM5_A1 TaxID=3379094 RepID=UPI00386EFCF2